MAFVHSVTSFGARVAAAGRGIGRALRIRTRDGAHGAAAADEERPFRAELLSAEQMERHGRRLAQTHEVRGTRVPDGLLERLAQNEAALTHIRDLLASANAAGRRIGPSGEWLLDNFYLLAEHIRVAKRHLPPGYSRQLPRLRSADGVGGPRVYDIALEAITHGDGRVDADSICRFVRAYQSVTPLTLGELWAIPIMLRIALIENLRRLGMYIVLAREQRDLAHRWADRMVAAAGEGPNRLILIVADMARSAPPVSGPFVAELVRRLQGRTSALALPLTWLEQRLSESGSTIERLVQVENQQQAADQVSVSNSVGSLRFLNALDWRAFMEDLSVVEQALRQDPAGVYSRQDFGTRDAYRHVVEALAQRSSAAEHDIARRAIELAAAETPAPDGDARRRHVGFYLIDAGLPELERAVGCRRTLRGRLRAAAVPSRLAVYVVAVMLVSAVVALVFTWEAFQARLPLALLPLIALVSAVAGSQLAIALVNLVATMLKAPVRLPRMDFSKTIPHECRSLVVIPAMLTGEAGIDALVESLEVRFLANPSRQIDFGLLTDFGDARSATLPEDETLLARAAGGIGALNAKYAGAASFFLFHRARRFNPRDRKWMGRERKRGKLEDLNALLRGRAEDAFAAVVGETAGLRTVRYVITLDTDTQLPRDAARQMIETMAHPLNRAVYDPAQRRVTRGYGILQPRVSASLAGLDASRYARLSAGEPGIDPYTRAVSDVYQDLFGEGSFIGKGIYDVDAFDRALAGQLPENRILSHDLLEGSYARAGLLSDVQVFETHPAQYITDAARRHRWIRGDWQIASWVLPRVPHPRGAERNPLSALARWKIFDNLRRSLAAPALVALFCLAWLAYTPVWLWTVALTALLFGVPALSLLIGLTRRSEDVTRRQHVAETARSAIRDAAQALLTLVFLAHEAVYSLDAALRSSLRVFRRRGLLDWTTSSEAQAAGRRGFTALWRLMWTSPVVALAIAGALAAARPGALLYAAPILFLWFAAPAIAWWISRAPSVRQEPLAAADVAFLRRVARRTWSYFDDFVGPADHHLPPDNYQEDPGEIVAHRTSPTNMGMALLANVSAYDFGYIPAGALLERTALAFGTMHTLERYEGHFYNWYDTATLAPLAPLYVSSVDSGNLAGYLMVLKAGLLALAEAPILHPHIFAGLHDTLQVLAESADADAIAPIKDELNHIEAAQSGTLQAAHQKLRRLSVALNALAATALPNDPRTTRWTGAAARQARQALEDLEWVAPWLTEPHGAVPSDGVPSLAAVAAYAGEAGIRARIRLAAIERLAQEADALAAISYEFLYDEDRHLLAIGYNASERRRDAGYYDLLASEARFTVFTGISQQKLPQESWFALGRLLTHTGGRPVLLSWSGSMFEYLMPLLVMPTYAHTLLDNTYRVVVERQIAYGRECGVPWGLSESGYNTFDAARNYQYRAFGVPGLGLARGLANDLVIAPYASALALMVDPKAACRNLQQLAREGAAGEYGFYEAVDYVPTRVPPGSARAVVKSFMAHHQGMTLLGLASALLGRPMQRRLERVPEFQATLLLLQERIPKPTAPFLHHTAVAEESGPSAAAGMLERVLTTADTPAPEVQLLSNGRYHVMVTNAGGGYSRWKDLAITRWREDATRDHWGTFCYVRDIASGAFWSSAHQPTAAIAEIYEARFSESRVEFRRRDHDYDTRTEIVVSPEDDIEVRRLHITNRLDAARDIDVTSYTELVLAAAAADAAHPAFSNLFVQTEIIPQSCALLGTRRPRSIAEPVPWMFHQLAIRGLAAAHVSYETDRARFIGRGRTVAWPQAMHEAELSGCAGPVLDPIAAIRCRVSVPANGTITIDLVSGAAESRDECLALIGKYRDRHLVDRVFDLSRTHSLVALRQITAADADVTLYGKLAAAVLYADPALRADAATLMKNRRGQPDLWGYAISGDLPIVLLKIGDPANADLVRQLVQAHAYWRLKGLAVDLVIWNEDRIGYLQILQDRIMGLIAAGVEAQVIDRPGGIFVRRGDQISDEDRLLLQAVARVIVSDQRGSLLEQITALSIVPIPPDGGRSRRSTPPDIAAAPDSPPLALIFDNGVGGFTADGREYVITTTAERGTPAPWSNVLANPYFGSVVSESGPSYTWSENAHEFRLTPWHNDPVTDASGEAFYLRDEDTGQYWSPTPLPCRGASPYLTRHGFGYTVYEHTEGGIRSELTVFVAIDAPIKLSVLRVTNASGRPRRLSATGYVEWVLGDARQKTAMHVVTEIEPVTGAVCARNRYNTEFSGRVAFFDVNDPARTVTGDRSEFIGRNGSLAHPAAMRRPRLSNRLGAGFDPCAGLHVTFALPDGETHELIFRLGIAGGNGLGEAADVKSLLERFRGNSAPRRVREDISRYWDETLGVIRVSTPDAALDVLANGWLVYQTLACRMWARSGYYQSGGAFGFRDQLQDAMALVHAEPQILRDQVLLCASRQYTEGDVQHWWHPPTGRGVRTRCSDDLLWLPLAIARYVATTADTDVLTQSIGFLEGRPVESHEDSYYELPRRAEGQGSLYEHGVRAITRALRLGRHGLPLMGTGDWNDGMNLVGERGMGESVWLAFFMYHVLTRFAPVARAARDEPFAARCEAEAQALATRVEEAAWDGEWYLRAFFDDGTPLGSRTSPECAIDSISQSWSVLSGAAPAGRARSAMDAVDAQLVDHDEQLMRLLAPPFDKSDLNPGYIKGYLPGVRENGGQYTHAAIWAAMAYAKMGDPRRAWDLFAMLNPINHARHATEVAKYKVEPYVIAADVYGAAPHVGRGGWTWYTGSAGWMYRLIVESLLGLTREGDRLSFAPCLPDEWPSVRVDYRFGSTMYEVTMIRSETASGRMTLSVDGVGQPDPSVVLIDDGVTHRLTLSLPRR